MGGGSSKPKKTEEYIFLLLGQGGSGKSTICKQMVADRLTAEERLVCAGDIYTATRLSVEACVREMDEEAVLDAAAEEAIEKFEVFSSSTEVMAPSSADWNTNLGVMKTLWDCPGLAPSRAKAVERGGYEQHLLATCTNFFFESSKFEMLSKPEYSPSDDDIARCRTMTTTSCDVVIPLQEQKDGPGMDKYYASNLIFRDVGGQLYRRSEWPRAFKGVDAMLYVVAYDAYNSVDSHGKNEMHNCIELGKDLASNKDLKDTPFIVLFNKQDLLRDMLKSTPLNVPGFTSKIPPDNVMPDEAMEEFEKYVMDIFIAERKKLSPTLQTSATAGCAKFRTCSLNKEMTQGIVAKVQGSVRELALSLSGM